MRRCSRICSHPSGHQLLPLTHQTYCQSTASGDCPALFVPLPCQWHVAEDPQHRLQQQLVKPTCRDSGCIFRLQPQVCSPPKSCEPSYSTSCFFFFKKISRVRSLFTGMPRQSARTVEVLADHQGEEGSCDAKIASVSETFQAPQARYRAQDTERIPGVPGVDDAHQEFRQV